MKASYSVVIPREGYYWSDPCLFICCSSLYIIVFKKISYFIFIPLIDIILKNTILYRHKYITKKVYFLSDEEIKELSFSEKNYNFVKRVHNIIFSIFMLILLSPIFLVMYFLIAILYGRPATIKQKEPAEKKETFICINSGRANLRRNKDKNR